MHTVFAIHHQFSSSSAYWGYGLYIFDFSVVWDNLGLFIVGACLTIQISLFSISFGLIAGIIEALFRTSGNRLPDWIAIAYVEAIRNTPFLIQSRGFSLGR